MFVEFRPVCTRDSEVIRVYRKMSWSKFNDSFNSLKGQLTTFVQEIVEPEDEDEEQRLQRESADVSPDQWQAVCMAQENEVIWDGNGSCG